MSGLPDARAAWTAVDRTKAVTLSPSASAACDISANCSGLNHTCTLRKLGPAGGVKVGASGCVIGLDVGKAIVFMAGWCPFRVETLYIAREFILVYAKFIQNHPLTAVYGIQECEVQA